MAKDTGLPRPDAQFDFTRAAAARALGRLTARLRREPSDVNVILPVRGGGGRPWAGAASGTSAYR